MSLTPAWVAVGSAVAVTSFFSLMSQPRTSTLETWPTALTRARNSRRFWPHTSWPGFVSSAPPASGPSSDGTGFLNSSLSPSTRKSQLAIRARPYRKSRSDWLTWNTCSNTPSVLSTSGERPASLAICLATSE